MTETTTLTDAEMHDRCIHWIGPDLPCQTDCRPSSQPHTPSE